MNFSPAATSTWKSAQLGQMLDWINQGESVDVTLVEEDGESKIIVIDITDESVEEVMEGDVNMNESQESQENYEMFDYTIVLEDTVVIDSSQEMRREENREDKGNESSEEETDSEDEGEPKYFAGCPVHNHHTDMESICPNDPPCVCLGDINE